MAISQHNAHCVPKLKAQAVLQTDLLRNSLIRATPCPVWITHVQVLWLVLVPLWNSRYKKVEGGRSPLVQVRRCLRFSQTDYGNAATGFSVKPFLIWSLSETGLQTTFDVGYLVSGKTQVWHLLVSTVSVCRFKT